MTDTGARDGGVDARTDARTDAGEGGPSDAGPTDAGEDAGPTCPATPGVYPLTTVGIRCSMFVATTMTLTEMDPPVLCAFGVLLDTASVGTFMSSDTLETHQLLGAISIAGGTPVRCVATFPAAGPVEIVCDDGCTFGVMRPAP